jgi:MFS family permease
VRHGYQPLVKAACAAGFLIPAWTIVAAAANALPATRFLAPFLFLLTYLTVGAYYSSLWVGFTNYLLEIVPEPERPLYIGILSTAAGPMAFLSAPGGLLVSLIGFLPTFLLASVGSLAAVAVAAKLPSERTLARMPIETGPG